MRTCPSKGAPDDHAGEVHWYSDTRPVPGAEVLYRAARLEVSTDQPFNDQQRWIELRIANSATRVVLFTPEGHESRIGTFFNGAFACDDVQATYRQLSARGVEFVKPPEKQPWGEFAIFKDPDGNQFVMSSS
jgi:predicted enzyme related to lactoylglutathione lyase